MARRNSNNTKSILANQLFFSNAIPLRNGLKDGQKKQGISTHQRRQLKGSSQRGVRLDAERQSAEGEGERDVSRRHFDDDEAAAEEERWRRRR